MLGAAGLRIYVSAMSTKKKVLFAIATVTLALTLMGLVSELILRRYFANALRIDPTAHQRRLAYDHDVELGWFPVANSYRELHYNQRTTVRHNETGFRDGKHGLKKKKRIAFVGDSFVWGFDVNKEERFTEKIQALMPDWEVMNLGVAGYSTDQELLLVRRYFDDFRPDIVVLIFCQQNDEDDNQRNRVQGGYYKPYFVEHNRVLKLKGVPVPKLANYYYAEHPVAFKSCLARAALLLYCRLVLDREIRVPDVTDMLIAEMRSFVEDRGARFAVGFESDNARLMSFCEKNNIAYIGLEHPLRYMKFSKHWTPRGHRYVAERIHNFLLNRHFLTDTPVRIGVKPANKK